MYYYHNGKCAYYRPAVMPNEVMDINKGFDCKENNPVMTDCFAWNESMAGRRSRKPPPPENWEPEGEENKETK
jgi:hypothetical protein